MAVLEHLATQKVRTRTGDSMKDRDDGREFNVAAVFTCIVRMFIIAIKEWHRTVALMFSHETHQVANGSLMVSKFPVLSRCHSHRTLICAFTMCFTYFR